MHLAEPEELGIDPSDRQTAAAEFYNSDFCILPNILFNKNYIFLKNNLGMSLGGISKQLRDHQFEQEQPRNH